MNFNTANINGKISAYGLAIMVSVFCLANCAGNEQNVSKKEESTYARVMRTGKIRAGYFLYPPSCMKDANTGKLSGFFVDALEEVGRNLNLEIEWKEEVGPGTMIEGLLSNRYDIVPTGVWPSAFRGKQADFSVPLFYSGLVAAVRPNDNRFTDPRAIDQSSVTVSTIDGQITNPIMKRQFPHAHILSHSESSDSSVILLDVASNKADITLTDPGIVSVFLKNNPGKLKIVSQKRPIAVYGITMMFKIDQPAFKSMLNTALIELLNTGYVDKLIAKYEPAPGAFYRVANPYEAK